MELTLNNFEVLDQTQMQEIDGGASKAAENAGLAVVDVAMCFVPLPVSVAFGCVVAVNAISDWAATQSRYLR